MGHFVPTGHLLFSGALLYVPMLVATRGIYENSPQVFQLSWLELVGWLTHCAPLTQKSREAIPLWSPGGFVNGAKDEHAQEREALVLDYDGKTADEFEHVRAAAAPFAHVIHTSHSHGIKEGYRFRLVVPFDRPVPIESWGHVWQAAVQFFGVAADRQCKNISRWYFLPASNPNAQPCWLERGEGFALSVDHLLSIDVHGVNAAGKIVGELAQHDLVSRAELGKLAAKLERKTVPEIQSLGRSLKKALIGEPFASAGYRNSTAYALAGEIAKEFPFGNADDITAHLQMGLEATGEPTVEAFAGMVRRQQSEKQATYSERRKVKWLNRDGEQPAEPQPETAVIPEGYPLIVQRDGFYWFRQRGSMNFGECYSQKDARLALLRYMPDVQVVGYDGELLGLDTILAEHSSPFRELEADYLVTQSTYDIGSKTLTLATAPRRPLVARYNPDVDRWLRALFGKNYSKAAQWIAALPFPHKAAPALYMHGVRGVGKGLLVSGLERLWYKPHTPLAETIGSFNPGLKASPLVFADEEIPKDMSLGWIRSFLTTKVRTVNEKFRPQFNLKGYTRLIIGANNKNVLAFTRAGELTHQDGEAVAERFLVLPVHADAKVITDSVDTDEWIARDYIAEHALWLASQIEIPVRGRWAVDAVGGDDLVADLAAPRFSWLAQTLVAYLAMPEHFENGYTSGNRNSWQIRTLGGRLWVSRAVLAPDSKHTIVDFDRAMRYLAIDTATLPLGTDKLKSHYWAIDIDRLFEIEKPTTDLETVVGCVEEDTETRLNRGKPRLAAVR